MSKDADLHAEDHFDEVVIKAVRKVFGRQPVLMGADAKLRGGELTVLMGPNGAGKSTLLGILSTLSSASSGEVRYGTISFADLRRYYRHTIGLLAHAPLLYGELNARENLHFFARLHGVDDVEARVERWLTQVKMLDAADRPLRLHSRGMTQRVALARALIHDPHLLLLDEPFTGLDREAIDILRLELGRARDSGKIIVVVSHDVDSLDGLCNQLLVLKRGRVIATVSDPEGLSADALQQRYREALRGSEKRKQDAS